MNKNKKQPFNGMSQYDLLQAIYSGTIDPEKLPKDVRQSLVEILILRGQEKIAIAKILKVNDRTVRRDVKDIWDRNALNRDPEFTRQFVGQMHLRAMSLVEMLTRMANSTDAKMNDRSLAAMRAWQSLNGLLEKLRLLGYLPADQQQPFTKVESSGDSLDKSERKKYGFTKKDEKLLIKINSMPQMERYRLRRDLLREIIKRSEEDAEGSKPESSDKGDDDLGAAGVVAT